MYFKKEIGYVVKQQPNIALYTDAAGAARTWAQFGRKPRRALAIGNGRVVVLPGNAIPQPVGRASAVCWSGYRPNLVSIYRCCQRRR
ncbi:MAG: hypothetical protein HC828_09650 [Blastochloris sp.]|nr:hypothetical protein [Blastochloris sp.]